MSGPGGPRSCVREGAWLEGWKSFPGMPTPACIQPKLRRREAGWRATEGEEVVRRNTNSIRPCRLASLRAKGEARTRSVEREAPDAEGLGAKAIKGSGEVVGDGRLRRPGNLKRRDLRSASKLKAGRRSQSTHSSAEAG